MGVMLQLFARCRGGRGPSSRTSSIRSRTGRRSGRCRRGPRRHYARTAVAFRLQHKHVQLSGKRPQKRLAAKGEAPPWTLTLRNDRLLSAIASAISWTTEVRPRVEDYHREQKTGDRWKTIEVIEELKPKAREAGLWNLFMPPGGALQHVDESFPFEGEQLTNLEYALCAEEMGRVHLVERGVQLLRAGYRQHGGAPPLRHARAEG